MEMQWDIFILEENIIVLKNRKKPAIGIENVVERNYIK